MSRLGDTCPAADLELTLKTLELSGGSRHAVGPRPPREHPTGHAATVRAATEVSTGEGTCLLMRHW